MSARGAGSVAEGAIIGSLAGALLGGAVQHHHGAANGAMVGGALGAAVGCWTAHQQAVAAAREAAINGDSSRLERDASELHQYNLALAEKVGRLRGELAQARANRDQYGADIRQASYQLASAQQDARSEIGQVDDAWRQVNQRMGQVGSQSYDYNELNQQRSELGQAHAQLQQILSFNLDA